MQLPLAHVLSRELQTYYDRVASMLLQKPTDAGELMICTIKHDYLL